MSFCQFRVELSIPAPRLQDPLKTLNQGKERKNVSQEEMDHIAEDLAKGLEAEGQKEWTAALPSSSIFATATGSGGSEDSATAADFFNSRFLQSDRRQKDFEPQGAENKRVAEKQNPEGTNEDSKKRRVDLGSKRNKISADITRDIEVLSRKLPARFLL